MVVLNKSDQEQQVDLQLSVKWSVKVKKGWMCWEACDYELGRTLTVGPRMPLIIELK